jgi:hypothetical protein
MAGTSGKASQKKKWNKGKTRKHSRWSRLMRKRMKLRGKL